MAAFSEPTHGAKTLARQRVANYEKSFVRARAHTGQALPMCVANKQLTHNKQLTFQNQEKNYGFKTENNAAISKWKLS